MNCLHKTQEEFNSEELKLNTTLKKYNDELNILLSKNVELELDTVEFKNKIKLFRTTIDMIIDNIIKININYRIHINIKINYNQVLKINTLRSKEYTQTSIISSDKFRENTEQKNKELYLKYIINKIIKFIKKCIKIKQIKKLSLILKTDKVFNKKNVLHRQYILLFIFENVDYEKFIYSNIINQIYIITGAYKIFSDINYFIRDFNTTKYFYYWIKSNSKLTYDKFLSFVKNKLHIWDNNNVETVEDIGAKKVTEIENKNEFTIINKNDIHKKYK